MSVAGRLAVGAAACLAALAPAAAQPVEVATHDVSAYRLSLTPDFQARSIVGEEGVSLRRQPGADRLSFSANALTIDAASFAGAPVRWRTFGDRLIFDLPSSAPVTGVLRVRYHGAPRRGLTFTAASVVSAYFTCDWMICEQDRPGDRARFDLRLVLPVGSTSQGPGRRTAVTRLADGREAHDWRDDAAHPAFVLGFAAGRFQTVTLDGRLSVLAQPDADAARVGRLFAPTTAMAAFFEERAGVSLPGGRYVQVLEPGDEAQEAAGFSILGEESVAAQETDPREDWAVAHELAHQWWGVSITCADWSQFWLNEGVTSFMVAAWKERRWGRPAYDAEIALMRRRWRAQVERDRDYPIAYAGHYPSLGARRAITYAKAAVFLDVLRTRIGEAAFWRGLRDYTRANLGRSVVTADFRRAMERSAGVSLAPLFDGWVNPPGGAPS